MLLKEERGDFMDKINIDEALEKDENIIIYYQKRG